MICPKCKASNDKEYTFCTECGTMLDGTPGISGGELRTEVMPSQDLPPTVLEQSSNLPPTRFYSATETNKDEPKPTEIIPLEKLPPIQPYAPAKTDGDEPEPTVMMPSQDLPPTVFGASEKLLPTQNYSPSKTNQNEPKPTEGISAGSLSPTVASSDKHPSAAHQVVPSESVAHPASANFQLEDLKTATQDKPPQKRSKVLLIGGVTLLVLLIGGAAAIYFLAQPMQENKSYVLTDNRQAQENTLKFDNQSKALMMLDGAKNDDFQKWRITPVPGNQNFYRFVNRGHGIGDSLQVVDDNSDSTVGMTKSAQDVGQFWAITNVQGDYYRITNKWLGETKSLAQGKQYYFFPRMRDADSKSDIQLWRKIPVPNGQGFYLVSKQYGESLTLQALTRDENKDKLVMKTGEYGSRVWNQKDLGNGYVSLTTSEGKALEVEQSELLKMAEASSRNSQSWQLKFVEGDYFQLVNQSLGEGKALEAVAYSTLKVQMLKTSDSDPAQLWKLSRIP